VSHYYTGKECFYVFQNWYESKETGVSVQFSCWLVVREKGRLCVPALLYNLGAPWLLRQAREQQQKSCPFTWTAAAGQLQTRKVAGETVETAKGLKSGAFVACEGARVCWNAEWKKDGYLELSNSSACWWQQNFRKWGLEGTLGWHLLCSTVSRSCCKCRPISTCVWNILKHFCGLSKAAQEVWDKLAVFW